MFFRSQISRTNIISVSLFNLLSETHKKVSSLNYCDELKLFGMQTNIMHCKEHFTTMYIYSKTLLLIS